MWGIGAGMGFDPYREPCGKWWLRDRGCGCMGWLGFFAYTGLKPFVVSVVYRGCMTAGVDVWGWLCSYVDS